MAGVGGGAEVGAGVEEGSDGLTLNFNFGPAGATVSAMGGGMPSFR
jgi:hypothetical protein